MSLEMKELMDTIPQIGSVDWIGVRPSREEPMESPQSVEVCLENGLVGDRFAGKTGAKRQVTLIQKEHFPVIQSILGCDEIQPATLRRNLVVSGINLQSLKDKQFSIGEVVLMGTGNCPPCSKMEDALGPGGFNAMRGHGGLCCTVIKAGKISVGDSVKVVVDA
jgi:MOSC domain-containing protein YiiM